MEGLDHVKILETVYANDVLIKNFKLAWDESKFNKAPIFNLEAQNIEIGDLEIDDYRSV